MTRETRFRNSIALRYFLATASVLILGELIFSVFIIYQSFLHQSDDLSNKAVTHANFLSEVTPDHILANNFYSIEKLMRQTASDPDFVYSLALTNAGSAVTTYLNGADPRVQEAIEEVETPDILARVQYLSQMDGIVEVESQIVADGLLIGYIRLGYSTDSLYVRVTQNIITTLLASGFISVLLGFTTLILFNIQIRNPLRELSMLAGQLATGHYDKRAEVRGNTEISQLQRAFNEMASELQHSITELDKLSQVASRTDNGVIITDAEGLIEWVNDAFTTMTGYSLEEVKGRTPGSVMQGPKSDAEVIQYMSTCLRRGDGFNTEIINYHKSGTQYWVNIEVRPVLDSRGKLRNFIGIETDITERKQSEDALRKALEKERELGELKSRFVSMASHEFRTPLTTILSTASFLESAEGHVSSEKRMARLKKVQNAAKEMNALLEDVLLFGKAEAERIEFHPAHQDIIAFAEEIREDIQATVDSSHQITVNNHLKNPIVSFDEKLMRQIITNLFTNAVKYSANANEITLELKCENDHLVMIVCDHGIGIPDADKERIFTPFHRAKNVRDFSGTGLGLAITKKAVEMHSGSISFKSKMGEGTCFTVCIPQK